MQPFVVHIFFTYPHDKLFDVLIFCFPFLFNYIISAKQISNREKKRERQSKRYKLSQKLGPNRIQFDAH